jgi:hypothetical protein
MFEEGRALGGQLDLAGRAVDQPHAQPRLQPGDQLADGRRRHAQVAGRRGEAAQRHDAGEGFHLTGPIDLQTRHDDLNSQMQVFSTI